MHWRKLSALVVAMVATALAATGITVLAAQDEESPLHKIMEKVQANNVTVLKGTRTAVNYKKNHEAVVTSVKELAKLGKEARERFEDVHQSDKPEPKSKWEELMDSYLKEIDTFGTLVENTETKQSDAKAGYKKVQASCTACHDVFRIDAE
jgi:cytochrome c556